MVCPGCGTENNDGAKFCRECGFGLALTCPECGHARTPEQKFCEECGASLAAAPARRLGAAETGAVGNADVGAPAARPVAHEPAVVAAEMRLVSVLFVDLVGFTSLSESRDAADVRDLLGRYFETARTIVERYGGTIEKFIGDAVMAVWGAPVAREDDAERAVRAALEMVDAVTVFGASVGAAELRARAGVVTGQVAALENPGEGLVVGDRVNTASRVQSTAQPGTVFVDEVTRQVTSSAIAYEDAGEHSVKGKTEPLRLWRALRVVAGVGGQDRAQGIEAPFVGRDGDLRLIKELFHGALERHSARLVAVSGDAGIGKSRLLHEFANYTDGLSSTVLWHVGRCLSYGEGVAYWALSEMVRARLGIPEEADSAEVSAKLAAGLERWVPLADDRAFLAPRLGALLGVAAPGLEREELFAGWRMFFERLADHEPVALVFEDLQWADEGLLDFIGQLLDWSAQSPIFVLTFARPELGDRRPGWPTGLRGATALQLEALDPGSMRTLLDGVVDGLPDAAAERIIAQAEGVPLYAIETIRALLDRGTLVEHDNRIETAGEIGDLDVPASLGSLLAARLDALTSDERHLIKSMSVFGGSFPRSTAAALGEVDEERLDSTLSSLVRKQVLAIRADRFSPDRGQYAFTQGLLRTVAYELLSRPERKTRHLAAAEHLRGAFPDEGEEVIEVIATHLLDAYRATENDADAGEIRVRAIAALRRAARRAHTVGAPERAAQSLLQAGELADDEPERTELTQAAGEMAMRGGNLEAALALFNEAATRHDGAGRTREAAGAAGRCGVALLRLGRDADAIARFRTALEALGADGLDAEAIRLNAGLGRVLAFAGETEEAINVLERALDGAAALELPDVLADALEARGLAFLFRGRPEESRLLLDGAAELATRHNIPELAMRARTNAAYLRLNWDLPGAEERFEAERSEARRLGNRYHEASALQGLVQVSLTSGRWDDAQQLAEAKLASGDAPENVSAVLALQRAWCGDPHAAREHLTVASAWGESDDPEWHGIYVAAEVAVLVAEGRDAEALERGPGMLADVLATLGAGTDPVRLGWPDTLQAALRLERHDTARELIDLLGELPPGRVSPYLRAELARGRAVLAAAEGRHEDVEPELGTAIEALRALGYPYRLALAQADLAEWLIGRGRADEAEAPLAEAIETFRSLGARPALQRAEAVAASVPAPDAATV